MRRLVNTTLCLLAGILPLNCDYYDPIDLNPIPSRVMEDTYIDIPDHNFLKALLERGVDSNGDSMISNREAERIKYLNISDEGISDLTGIEAFKNLECLKCDGNPLVVMNLEYNSYLKKLSCQKIRFHFRILNLSENKNLKILMCDSSRIKEIWIGSNIKLEKLTCNNIINLTNLCLSRNKKLKYVSLKDIPSLRKVCVWQMPFPPVGVKVDTTNSPNVYFTTNCD